MTGELESNYDQSLLITPSEERIFSDVEEVIANSKIQADPRPALEFGRNLRRDGQLKGLALAKLLYMLDGDWALFKHSGIEEDIEEIVFVEMGISPQTTRKYIRLWEDVFENPAIPGSVKEQLYGKSVKSLLLLTAAARDGDDIDWDKVSNAENGAEIRDLVRGVRGPTTSSETSIMLKMERDGTLFAVKGTSPQRYTIGKLLVGAMDDPVISKAIIRLMERGGILWL